MAQASKRFKLEKQRLKERIASEIEETTKKLSSDGNYEASEQFKRSLRSQAKGETNGPDTLEMNQTTKSRKTLNESLGIDLFINSEDILGDIEVLESNWVAACRLPEEQTVEVVNGTLVLNGESIAVNDQVVVKMNEEMSGTVLSIMENDVMVRLNDDSNVRVLVSHLKEGRCKISKERLVVKEW